MVRFKVNYGAHIARNLHYLDYDRMKVILHEQEHEETKSLLRQHTAAPVDHDHASKFSQVFFEEIARVDNCYVQFLIDLDYTLVDMQRLANEYLEKTQKPKEKWHKKAQEAALKRSATTLHNKLTKLETYRLLNRTAAIKILKKHDKLAKITHEEPLLESHMARVDHTNFGDGTKLQNMRAHLEGLYADVFCHGVLEEAQGKLRLAKTLTDPAILLGVAFKTGIVITLLMWIANNFILAPHLSLLYLTIQDPSVYVYTAVGALLTYRWLWGFCVYMWDSVDIDYILILDLDANKHMPSSDQIFSDTANLTVLYLVNVLLFHALRYQYKFHHSDGAETRNNSPTATVEHAIDWLSERAYIMPILLVMGTLIRVSIALRDPSSKGVFSTKTFTKLVSAPMSAVHLRHTYAADILCSLTKVFEAIVYSGCYFTSGAFVYASDPTSANGMDRFATCTAEPVHAIVVCIYLYPIFIRIMQCLRQRRDHFVRLSQVAPSKITQSYDVRRVDSTSSSHRDDSVLAGVVVHASGSSKGLHGLRSRISAPGALTLTDALHTDLVSTSTGNVSHVLKFDSENCGEVCDHDASEEEGVRLFHTVPCSHEQDDQVGEGVGEGEGEYAQEDKGIDEDGDYIDAHRSVHSDHFEDLEAQDYEDRLADELDDHEDARHATNHKDDFDLHQDLHEDHSSAQGSDHGCPSGLRNKPKPVRRPSLSKGESFDIPTPAYMRTLFDFLPAQLSAVLSTLMVWPYSYNALRYVLNFAVVLFGKYPPQDPTTAEFMWWYIPLCVISTLYSCYWDVANDFKLMQGTAPKPFLRDKLFYEETEYFYYIVLLLNPILRFMWTLAFTPYGTHPFLVCFEILRRSLWACMRMELGYIQELARRK